MRSIRDVRCFVIGEAKTLDEQGNVERFEITRVYDEKMLRLDFANPAISHRLADATKYNDDYLDDLFKEFGIIR